MLLAKRFKLFFIIIPVAALSLWLFRAATTVDIPTPSNPLIFYSNQANDDLHLLFRKVFEKAKKEILLHVYAVSDPLLLQILEEKQKEGVKVTLFYDPTSCGKLNYPFAYPIRTSGLMHRKIAVIDQSLIFLGTANLTGQSLHFHDNLIVGLSHSSLAPFFSNCSSPYQKFDLGECWLLPDEKGKAATRLLELIHAAKKTIRVAMFTLTHPDLVEGLIAAKNRGVEVECAVDFYTAQGASSKAIAKLTQAGLKVYQSQGRQLLHHKWTWIDEEFFVIGSANWTRAAFEKNQDCFMILNQIPLKEKKKLKRIWQRIRLECKLII